jgi:hypothetical protein
MSLTRSPRSLSPDGRAAISSGDTPEERSPSLRRPWLMLRVPAGLRSTFRGRGTLPFLMLLMAPWRKARKRAWRGLKSEVSPGRSEKPLNRLDLSWPVSSERLISIFFHIHAACCRLLRAWRDGDLGTVGLRAGKDRTGPVGRPGARPARWQRPYPLDRRPRRSRRDDESLKEIARQPVTRSSLVVREGREARLAKPDFAKVRGDQAPAGLSEAERPAWQKLSPGVAHMLPRARGRRPGRKRPT